MDTVRVRALRPFTEYVPGRGMVVFSAERKADSSRGITERKATEDDLPVDVAEDRVRRRYAEAIGKGAPAVKKSAAETWRERRMAAREARRRLIDHGGGNGMGGEGDLAPLNADDRQALSEVQDAITKGDDVGKAMPTADGPGTQAGSTPRSETVARDGAEGEDSSVTADKVGDGANAVLPENALNDALAARNGGDDDAEAEAKPKRTRRARGTGARRGGRRSAASKKGGETAVPTEAPTE